MKKLFSVGLILISIISRGARLTSICPAQNIAGENITVFCHNSKDSLILICFWSVASEESITELNSINNSLASWETAKSFRFMAVSIDESKAASRMRPIYNMNGWTFDSYVDLYGDLRRALHSNNVPQSMIIYKNKVIYQQSGWSSGSENYLIQRLSSMKN